MNVSSGLVRSIVEYRTPAFDDLLLIHQSGLSSVRVSTIIVMTPSLATVLAQELDEDRAYIAYTRWRTDRHLPARDACIENMLPLVGTIFRSHIRPLYRRHGVTDDGDAIAAGIDRMVRCIARRHFVCTRCDTKEAQHFMTFTRFHVHKAMQRQFFLAGRQVYDFGTSGQHLPYGRVRTHSDANNAITLANLPRIILAMILPRIRFADLKRKRVVEIVDRILHGESVVASAAVPDDHFYLDYAHSLIITAMYDLRASGDIVDDDFYECLGWPSNGYAP